jgi:hypothetical protein
LRLGRTLGGAGVRTGGVVRTEGVRRTFEGMEYCVGVVECSDLLDESCSVSGCEKNRKIRACIAV